MTYSLDPGQTIADSVRMVAADQIDRARLSIAEAGADPEAAVHDLRKRMKKLRALLRLVRPGLGDDYGRRNAFFRDIARRFSAIRDAQVLSETVEALRGHDATGSHDALDALVDWAARRRAAALEAANLDAWLDETDAKLSGVRSQLDGWEVDDPLDAVQGGLKRSFKRARRGYRDAMPHSDPDVLHEWRKRVKYHWYHVRLLEKAWPDAMKARADSLDRIAESLGEDHDVVVLLRRLHADRDEIAAPARARAEALAMARRQSLIEPAMLEAGRIFAETPKALAKRLTVYWSTAAIRG